MARQKEASQTEKPTPKRLRDARKEGQIHKSQDLSSTLQLAVWLLLAWLLAGQVLERIRALFELVLLRVHEPFDVVLGEVFSLSLEILVIILVPMLLAVAIMSLLVEFVQAGPVFAPKRAAPNMQHVSPAEGMKRMFSQKNLVEVVKALLKSIVLAAVGYVVLTGLMPSLGGLADGSAHSFADAYWSGLSQIIFWVVFVFLFIAAFDVAYQKQQYIKDLMMSRRDIKQEHKDTEGNPEIKGQRKGMHREFAQTSVIDAVLGSNAVVRNHTHFAVAVSYDPDTHDLPVVTAKGSDDEALRIIGYAEQGEVPIMENRALARGLHEAVDVDSYISEEFFDAVAHLLRWAEQVGASSEQQP